MATNVWKIGNRKKAKDRLMSGHTDSIASIKSVHAALTMFIHSVWMVCRIHSVWMVCRIHSVWMVCRIHCVWMVCRIHCV